MLHDMSFGWMGFGWIFWVIIIGVIVYLILKIPNQSRSENFSLDKIDSPLEILKKRYARGEVTKAEFDKIKNDLTQK